MNKGEDQSPVEKRPSIEALQREKRQNNTERNPSKTQRL